MSIFSAPGFKNNNNKCAVLEVNSDLRVKPSVFEKSQENQAEKRKQNLDDNDGEIKLMQKEFKFLDGEDIDSYNY